MSANPPVAPALERFLTYRIHLVGKLSDRESGRMYLEACGIPLGEARCLAAIGSFAPLSVNDLARAANLDKGQASRCAQALVERGLVVKTVSSADARGVVLTLTAAGRARHRKLMQLIGQRNDEIFGCLSEAERGQLASMLDKVIAASRTEPSGADDA